jgi:hypothetical protein
MTLMQLSLLLICEGSESLDPRRIFLLEGYLLNRKHPDVNNSIRIMYGCQNNHLSQTTARA